MDQNNQLDVTPEVVPLGQQPGSQDKNPNESALDDTVVMGAAGPPVPPPNQGGEEFVKPEDDRPVIEQYSVPQLTFPSNQQRNSEQIPRPLNYSEASGSLRESMQISEKGSVTGNKVHPIETINVPGDGVTPEEQDKVEQPPLELELDPVLDGDALPANIQPEIAPVDVAKMSYDKQKMETDPNQELQSYRIVSTASFFVKHSYRDVCRKCCHFCLSFSSVFIVVWAALVINTIVEKGPVIFLKLAEADNGQYDGIVYPQDEMNFESFQNTEGIFINYTKSMEVLAKGGKDFNLSPRKTFCSAKAGSAYPQLRKNMDVDPLTPTQVQALFKQDLMPDEDGELTDEQFYKRETALYNSTSEGDIKLPTYGHYYFRKVDYNFDICAIFLDTDREREIAAGIRYPFDRLKEGQCIIHKQMAQSLHVGEGDAVLIQMNARKNFRSLIWRYNSEQPPNTTINDIDDRFYSYYKKFEKFNMSCIVADFSNQSYGKVEKKVATTAVYMEYDTIYKHWANFIEPDMIADLPTYKCDKYGGEQECTFKDWLQANGTKLSKEYTDFMLMTLPSPREQYYQSSDYLKIQGGVTGWANEIVDGLGFYPIKIDMPVLGAMQNFGNAILMLGLIFDIIIMLFIILSVLLIYSLLMISVESKTFEFGVMRMVGLSKSGIVSMIVIQGFMFVLPSVIAGFALSFPTLKEVYALLFTADMGLDYTPVPSTFAIFQALLIGILIPIISSIVPIQAALAKNLNDSLDLNRSKSQAINIQILDPNKTNMGSYIVFGLVGVIYGLGIYYFLPLAMLSFNFALILQIFFAILIAMLYGLSLLAFNLQRFMEIFLTYLLLFWEKSSMRQMIFKNLTAHKLRNKMTSIIFSISIGFIIFLVVIYKLQIQSTELISQQRDGCYFIVSGKKSLMRPELFDPIFQRHRDTIDEFSFVSSGLHSDNYYGFKETQASDKARASTSDINIMGVQPNIFDALIQDFISINQQTDSSLSISEQLYSRRGLQSGATGEYVVENANYNLQDQDQYLLVTTKPVGYGVANKYFKKRIVWTSNQVPKFRMLDRSKRTQDLLINIPQFINMYGPYKSINETRYSKVFIKFKGEAGSEDWMAAAEDFMNDAKNSFNDQQVAGIRFYNAKDDTDTMMQVTKILDSIFNIIIVITMLLCLFSLVSSMSANLFDQTKEIGVLRAMGFTKIRIKLLYFYEAFILVMASSLLGIMIGTTVAFTMVLQQIVFIQIPLFFFFPYEQFFIIMGMSLICAFVSSWGPTGALVRNDIAKIFRMGA